MNRRVPLLLFFLLASAALSVATWIQPRALAWNKRAESGGVMKLVMGEGRRLFANHFFEQADVYFHSGYYPSIFDREAAPKDTRHLTAQEGSAEEEEHERKMSFLGPPKDWIERFGRHFLITSHTHLEAGSEREILPWLRVAAELDPQRVETYTVAGYWLRNRLGKVQEAEQFLREGLRNNPNSYEILFELGQLYSQNRHEVSRARNVWELALLKWNVTQEGKKEPDLYTLDKIAINLARLEENEGDYRRAIKFLELATQASPNPAALREQIAELKKKLPASQ